MWQSMVNMSKEESVQYLRNLELEAYSHLVSALRAQGSLNSDKKKLLNDTGIILNISQERHNAEIRRAITDERLNTVAFHVSGQSETIDEWAQEGRRAFPLIARYTPETAYTCVADEVAESVNHMNNQIPSSQCIDRKKIVNLNSFTLTDSGKPPFRMPEPPKMDDIKKRKLSPGESSSCLAQHLLGPSKNSKIQQLYRQRSKLKSKESCKLKEQELPKSMFMSAAVMHPKINVLQNISLQPPSPTEDPSKNNMNQNEQNTVIGISNENQAPHNKLNSKPVNMTYKPLPIPGTSNDHQKCLKLAAPKKPPQKPGQKLIVVSNSPTVPSNSVLQRTLNIPFVKSLPMKNFEKFKIVSATNPNPLQAPTTNSNNLSSVKHKVVTVRTNPATKKVIPLSQLQVLHSKANIKVLPFGSKIVGKAVPTTTSSMYIMNSMNTHSTLTRESVPPVMSTVKTDCVSHYTYTNNAIQKSDIQPQYELLKHRDHQPEYDSTHKAEIHSHILTEEIQVHPLETTVSKSEYNLMEKSEDGLLKKRDSLEEFEVQHESTSLQEQEVPANSLEKSEKEIVYDSSEKPQVEILFGSSEKPELQEDCDNFLAKPFEDETLNEVHVVCDLDMSNELEIPQENCSEQNNSLQLDMLDDKQVIYEGTTETTILYDNNVISEETVHSQEESDKSSELQNSEIIEKMEFEESSVIDFESNSIFMNEVI